MRYLPLVFVILMFTGCYTSMQASHFGARSYSTVNHTGTGLGAINAAGAYSIVTGANAYAEGTEAYYEAMARWQNANGVQLTNPDVNGLQYQRWLVAQQQEAAREAQQNAVLSTLTEVVLGDAEIVED